MSVEPRPEVLGLAPVAHGGLDDRELRRLGLDPAQVLDFSANINPYGPPTAVRAALTRAAVGTYPDREATLLTTALARGLGVAPEQVLAGNGAVELIGLTALAFLRPGDHALVFGPTFGEYARAAALMGAHVTTVQALAEAGFRLDVEAAGTEIARLHPRLVFLCNPNNPTGTVLPVEAVEVWARRHPQTLFVVDEAYLAFTPGLPSVLGLGAENVLVLRSLTKDYALAGLRLGYAVGPPDVIGWLARVRPPWSVNAAAQAAGVAALLERDFLRQSLARLGPARDTLTEALRGLGLEVLPSAVHFFLVRVGDGAAFRERLLRMNVLVRDAASFGLPEYVRIATRRPEENECLVAAVRP